MEQFIGVKNTNEPLFIVQGSSATWSNIVSNRYYNIIYATDHGEDPAPPRVAAIGMTKYAAFCTICSKPPLHYSRNNTGTFNTW